MTWTIATASGEMISRAGRVAAPSGGHRGSGVGAEATRLPAQGTMACGPRSWHALPSSRGMDEGFLFVVAGRLIGRQKGWDPMELTPRLVPAAGALPAYEPSLTRRRVATAGLIGLA